MAVGLAKGKGEGQDNRHEPSGWELVMLWDPGSPYQKQFSLLDQIFMQLNAAGIEWSWVPTKTVHHIMLSSGTWSDQMCHGPSFIFQKI